MIRLLAPIPLNICDSMFPMLDNKVYIKFNMTTIVRSIPVAKAKTKLPQSSFCLFFAKIKGEWVLARVETGYLMVWPTHSHHISPEQGCKLETSREGSRWTNHCERNSYHSGMPFTSACCSNGQPLPVSHKAPYV